VYLLVLLFSAATPLARKAEPTIRRCGFTALVVGYCEFFILAKCRGSITDIYSELLYRLGYSPHLKLFALLQTAYRPPEMEVKIDEDVDIQNDDKVPPPIVIVDEEEEVILRKIDVQCVPRSYLSRTY
jgi:hypothetical protein